MILEHWPVIIAVHIETSRLLCSCYKNLADMALYLLV